MRDGLEAGCGTDGEFQVIRKEGPRLYCRGWHERIDRERLLELAGPSELAASDGLAMLTHEYALRHALDSAWAVRPLDLVRDHARTALVFEEPEAEPLDELLGEPMAIDVFLRIATGLCSALAHLHASGIVHKDVKPANVRVDVVTGRAWLSGFGIASRLPRERAMSTSPPELMTGTLAYMAPEQTGRMNRSIDSRTDLYALGVTFYEMLTGQWPFTASDPLEWIHCHIARRAATPRDRVPSVPLVVSAIVMKLLAKTAEERYQTAAGVLADLQWCIEHAGNLQDIEGFPIGKRDMSDRLWIPEKLYGRGAEIAQLVASFERVVATGVPELTLVSGYSGIGKSSVVHELHKALVPPRGLFVSGKYDQYQRDVPYATLAQAFQGLVRGVLGKGDAELRYWRDALGEALGPNGQLIANLVPEIELILGPQPRLPDLPPQDAQGRFQRVFRRFLGVFARAEHPLVLFLDDLQWLDAATLDLLGSVLTQQDVGHWMVIGAYRDNEVDVSHPLIRMLESIRASGTRVHEVVLAPLAIDDVSQLLADTLHGSLDAVSPLAGLVHEKTGGNPFFAIQFIQALTEEGWLVFDPLSARWTWDLHRIRAKGYTDNVVELMVGKLSRLPDATRGMLEWLACVGTSADAATLALVRPASEAEVHAQLWEAVRNELVVRFDDTYTFAHDRIHEAAYSLIPESDRAGAHWRIGQLLDAHMPEHRREEAVFDIVSQLNRGASLMTSRESRGRLAELNLLAGRRAKRSSAYASALKYLEFGEAVLRDDPGSWPHDLVFSLALARAECEFLTGSMQAAELRLSLLSARARSAAEQSAVACLRVDLYTALNQSSRAVEVCLDYLRRQGLDYPAHPSHEDGAHEYARVLAQVGDREIEQLIDLPFMDHPAALATMDVLTKAFPPALFTDAKLLSLFACLAVNLGLAQGHSDGSAVAYVWLGMIAGPHFGDYDAGFRFGRLGYELVEKRGLERFKARTYLWFGQFVVPWTRHVTASRELFRRAFDAANAVGDLTVAAYSCNNLNTNLLAAGDPLSDAQAEAEHGLAFARQAYFGFVTDIVTPQLALIRMLRGLTAEFGSLDDGAFREDAFERHLASQPALALPECWYWVRKLQARFFAGRHAAAIEAAQHAQRLLWTSPSIFEAAEYHFYAALAHAAVCKGADDTVHFEALARHRDQLDIWAANGPENFDHRAALVQAEIARVTGQYFEAMERYEYAIRSARANRFVHHEALANELAARFYLARGFERIARTYLRDARQGYRRWGAERKVRHLDELDPRLEGEARRQDLTSTFVAPVEQLDLATVLKVSQAASSEIVREKLIDTLMRTALEHAGAVRGVLVLPGTTEQRIEAVTGSGDDAVTLCVRDAESEDRAWPESLIEYVLRTRTSIILDDAQAPNPFSEDPYIVEQGARSVLCIPFLHQAKLVGVLYLENNLCSHAFTPTRVAVLKLLASQAAISLENTELYRNLEEREARIRRLVDSNIVGIFIFDSEGHIVDANDAFLSMIGYDRAQLISGHIRWPDLTSPAWTAFDDRALDALLSGGELEPSENELIRGDGERVPVLIGAASFGGRDGQGAAFVVNLSERKRAEREKLDSEQRFREIEHELVRANRIATIGQLSASIAHEIRQPITAAVINGRAALRWIDANPPNIHEVRLALNRIVDDANRAGTVVGGIHALVKRSPTRRDDLDINEIVRDVIAMAHSEAIKYGVLVSAQLDDALPRVTGDPIQLQQVVLNLMINAFEAMSAVSWSDRELAIVTARAEGESIEVALIDSGPRLDAGQLDRVFEAFYTTKPGGLGMGLSICRSIIDAHGGALRAVAGDARGAEFRFVLPVRAAQA
ncbi:trifunctional serine/threonine-protein kinase/ATP-binding protein/sensor histidine kinase [Pararobbsia silviterrae]|uniref:histidine kinase n=1 Tax=Pararobbsia silviterrae TaxID=1792498 RepID=A0A494XZR0_9BURK|nr:ATP-binding sensor histidine kinase [Pararobbsia silviterrae]RKP55995.1 PAS domain S-box protein [Pararobbsia silviterrae]